ncbi:exodeoxyribonuclease V subunit alpha [Singulisphaera acidiphila]|uniref:Exodeoxyribonuclease V, alpha subunit n=1 Tax=Singulisphaera acidiphila (strain ATCC BAA-1392 / DSM 18658 / VKM B-2454 / MOB10) TaxID=886293 RepID=L0DJ49_SINAD|nr:exodeoxyribonuclease V subunit alpha [Singulisphaera acidiphila]AGA28701.1 exodeoxyribonuclease V, alpha subunit [Singulisphaera acidiphila DSM 18658]
MRPLTELSPSGTARAVVATGLPPSEDDEAALLAWLRPVRERIAASFNLEEEVAFLAWELGRLPPGLNREERAALILLALTALIALRQGSTRLPFRDRAIRLEIARQLLQEEGSIPGLDAARAVKLAESLIEEGRVAAIVGGPEDFKPLIVDGPYLYLQKMRALEERFADALRRRIAGDGDDSGWPEAEVAAAVLDVEGRPAVRNGVPLPLSDDQLAAVRTAASHRLAVISGGPGTGKTTIVVSILRVLRRLGIPPEAMLLAAPTGKAAQRLGQSIQAGLQAVAQPSPEDNDLETIPEPRTLHRLLGYSPSTGRFLHHENNRLAGRVVVVDEGSMIDLVLMERLARSLRDDARLVLLGDDHQLPSVEAGAVLRDLLAEDDDGPSPLGPRAVRLTQSHRMRPDDPDGRNILTVSQAIDRGETPRFAPSRDRDDTIVERPSLAEVTFQGVEFLEASEGSGVIEALLHRWTVEVIRALPDFDDLIARRYLIGRTGFSEQDQGRLTRLFDHFDRSRVLCLTRVLPSGADRINDRLHDQAFAATPAGSFRADDLLPGEPVMMQVNDYSRMLFNGDQGLILSVSEGGRPAPMVVFRRADEFVTHRIGSLRSVLRRSYAMTVHKSQGSEFDRVALILPDADIPLNTREILYTALTRSRGAVTLVGSRDTFAQGVARSARRYSGVAERVRAAPRPPQTDLESVNWK